MEYLLLFKGQMVPVEFSPDDKIRIVEEIYLDMHKYGALDLVKKKEGDPNGEVVVKNGIFSLMKCRGEEAYITDCRDYKKICNITEIQELRSSPCIPAE